ncbi:hypothetical protein HPB52_020649 [Rhipicephalus sanguineus]|uniref:Mutator-like transposase domain-containing protein n=1 Tax=Rhipicephalus sanguineus TaxID=34632 RepID=A0A9D4T7X4_RHISA|nr:hypothetical protein HPB52_020649 [Rhipicephalus sanguineus]
MASLKQNGRRRGFSEARLSESPIGWRDRHVIFFFFVFGSPPWLSVCVRLLLRSCVFLDGPCLYFVPVVFPRDRDAWRLSSETIDATSFWKPAPSAAELESRPDPLDLPGTSTDDTVGPSSTSETLRVDAAYYSTAEQAQRVERSAQTKTVLSGKSATQRKFDLLGVSAECQTGDAGTDFLLVDMKVLNNFFAQAKCDKCDAKSLSVRKATDKEYGLAVKLIFSCSSCDFEKKQFSSPRVSGTATITPFEVNMRAMKGIQMIGKDKPMWTRNPYGTRRSLSETVRQRKRVSSSDHLSLRRSPVICYRDNENVDASSPSKSAAAWHMARDEITEQRARNGRR